MNALSLNPSGPPQYKQTQTEEFSSQHVILHRAQTTGTNLGLRYSLQFKCTWRQIRSRFLFCIHSCKVKKKKEIRKKRKHVQKILGNLKE